MWLEKPGWPNRRLTWSPGQGHTRRVEMSPGGALEGIVLDAARVAPLERFRVITPQRSDPREEAPAPFNRFSGGVMFEGTGGRFRVEGLAHGPVGLRIEAPGFAALETGFDLGPGEECKGLILQLEPGGSVRGSVVDAEGHGVAGAQVLARRADGSAFVDLDTGFRVDTRADRIRQNCGKRKVTYLMGALDNDPNAAGLDKDCGGMIQGVIDQVIAQGPDGPHPELRLLRRSLNSNRRRKNRLRRGPYRRFGLQGLSLPRHRLRQRPSVCIQVH